MKSAAQVLLDKMAHHLNTHAMSANERTACKVIGQMLLDRSTEGEATYGAKLTPETPDLIQHTLEEAVDLMQYGVALQGLRGLSPDSHAAAAMLTQHVAACTTALVAALVAQGLVVAIDRQGGEVADA